MTCLLESDGIQFGQQQKKRELFQHRQVFPTTTNGSTSTGLSTVKKRSHFSIFMLNSLDDFHSITYNVLLMDGKPPF